MKIHIIAAIASIVVSIMLFFTVYMPVVHVNKKTSSHMLSELKKVEDGNYGH